MGYRNNDSWNKNYELAKNYFLNNNDLEISHRFKTNDGVNYDENGYPLGIWIVNQRIAYKYNRLDNDRYIKLQKIGMRFNNKRNTNYSWDEIYSFVKKYKEHYGNVKISANFRTNDGINYDEDGISLNNWLAHQKYLYKNNKLSKEKEELLISIGFSFAPKASVYDFNEYYHLANTYYKHYGNTNIKVDFKTNDGINYDENGKKLGAWISYIRRQYILNKLSEDKIEMLKKIDIRIVSREKSSKSWDFMYSLAVNYYNKYGNLDVPVLFKTENGVDYCTSGYTLGTWVKYQRDLINKNLIDEERKNLLLKLNIRLKKKISEENWKQKYELVKKYYEYYGNLNVPEHFKTKDGINYDENGEALGLFIQSQRSAYKGLNTYKMTLERIKLLTEIGMIWLTDVTDDKLQNEVITENNIARKKKEILNRARSILLMYKDDDIPNKDEINDEFIKRLNR